MKIRNEIGETIKAGCIVINDTHEILLVKHQDGANWGFPKGHAERGETLKQVALRETLEETGYEVELIRRLPDIAYTKESTGESIRTGMFLAKPVQASRIPEKELKWVPLSQISQFLYPNLIAYLKDIQTDLSDTK